MTAQQYHASRRQDGLFEIYLYVDDPAYRLAERFLKKHNFSALSAGHIFVGRPEDYFRFEVALMLSEAFGYAPATVPEDKP